MFGAPAGTIRLIDGVLSDLDCAVFDMLHFVL